MEHVEHAKHPVIQNHHRTVPLRVLLGAGNLRTQAERRGSKPVHGVHRGCASDSVQRSHDPNTVSAMPKRLATACSCAFTAPDIV